MSAIADLERAFASAEVARAKKPQAFYLDVVVRSGLDVSIADAITEGNIERAMDGASTFELTVFDPHRALLRNPDLSKAIDMYFGGYWWRLVKVGKSGDNLTLTFEDREVAYLRTHKKPRSAKRNQVTRAQFIRQLVREVGQRPHTKKKKAKPTQRPIIFVCPELRQRQPIGKAPKTPARRTKKGRDDNKQPGINPHARLTVRKVRADPTQRKNGERCLDVADHLNAGPKATLALMEAVINESNIRNLTYGDSSSVGILQLLDIHGPVSLRRNVEHCVKTFLTKGFTGRGGAMALARQHPTWSAADVATAVQGNLAGAWVYGQFKAEAQRWVDAYGGASGSDTGGTAPRGSSRANKKYQFRRGEPGKPEDSWTAIQRLAEEVQWHAFMDRGRLYYVSDNYLMRQKPRYIVGEDDDGIDEINFDVDAGKVSSTITVQAHAKRFQVPVGCVMGIRDCGVASGRYIVTSVRQSIFDNACEITLRAPTKKLPEPSVEDTSTPGRTTTQGDDGTATTGGSLRDKIVAVAQASRKSYNRNPNSWFYSQGGASIYQDPTKPPRRGTRSDCSQWVCCVYKKAGAPAPGSAVIGATGTMRAHGHEVSLSRARPGDIILYGSAPSHHVELYVGPGQRTIGHGSPPVDYGTIHMMGDAHCWRYDFLD